jgi:D-3-phosphoglycerate dehydrogenase, putative (fragment)
MIVYLFHHFFALNKNVHNVILTSAPGGNTIAAAELTCAMLLGLSRKLIQASSTLKNGVWDKKSFMGSELSGKVLAIIGLGRIGREVARRMQSFGMKTIGYDPFLSAEVTKSFGVEHLDLDKLWPQADYITFHVPLEPSTKNLINKTSLAKCKRGVKIINVARGGIVDEKALLNALQTGQCGGAGLDVFEEEPSRNAALLSHPLVICTPHLGASTWEAQHKVAEEISISILHLMDGRSVAGIVNKNQIK